MKKVRQWPEVYFLIDLHGTIIPSGRNSEDRTDMLEFYPDAKEVLQWLSNRKDIFIILWTSTPATRLDAVWAFFEKHNITFNYINHNPHAKDTPRSDFSLKPYFNVVLDDRGGFEADTDWTLIKQELIRVGEWNKII